jgi:hypothetical protein
MIVCIEKTQNGTYSVWEDSDEAPSSGPSALEKSPGGMMGDTKTDMKGASATMTGNMSPVAARTDNSGMQPTDMEADAQKTEVPELKDALLLAGRMLMSSGSDQATDAFNAGVNDTRPRYA